MVIIKIDSQDRQQLCIFVYDVNGGTIQRINAFLMSVYYTSKIINAYIDIRINEIDTILKS